MIAKDLTYEYNVGRLEFRARSFAMLCKTVANAEFMDFSENKLRIAFNKNTTTKEERDFIMSLLEYRAESSSDWKSRWYLTSFDVRRFSAPKESYKLNFSNVRYSFAYLFENYLNGKLKHTTKTKKTDIAKFGHLDKTASQNLSAALRSTSNRKGTFEFMSICCLYFHVEPIFAITLFHQCEGLDELQSYPYIGAALYLFLEDERYDYELFVKTACKAIKEDEQSLPEAVQNSRYWREVYEAV